GSWCASHSTPSGWGWVSLPGSGGCTPGYSIPPLRGGCGFEAPGYTLRTRLTALSPQLFHSTPSGWVRIRRARLHAPNEVDGPFRLSFWRFGMFLQGCFGEFLGAD